MRKCYTKKSITVLLLCCLSFLVGCGYNQYMFKESITSPICVFEYDGCADVIYSEILRTLVLYNFPVFATNQKPDVLVTEIRCLYEITEYYDYFSHTGEYEGVIRKDEQSGRLIFLFTDLGNNKTEIKLFTHAFIDIDATAHGINTPNQHKFLNKYIDIIKEIPNIKLISEPEPEQQIDLSSRLPSANPTIFKSSSYTPIIVGIAVVAIMLAVALFQWPSY